jgi:hypothetical protein
MDVPIINVDMSNMENATTYSINEVICNPVIKEYINGNELRQFLFTFSSIENYGSDGSLENPNISNLNFYENFLKWIKDNSKNKILPALESGQTAEKIEVLTGGYLFNNSADGGTALYQAQLKLIYEQRY